MIDMGTSNRARRRKKERLGNRMALIGITGVILSMAVVVSIKGATLQDKDLEYMVKEENLEAQKAKEKDRAAELEERRIYVQTKQYIEEVAKEKLGLVNPDEVILKPKG